MTTIGTTLGQRYRLDTQIGEGAYGVVFRATDLVGGQEVAVKVLRAEHLRHERVRTRVLREAEILKTFDHPNVARALEVVSENNQIAVVLELYSGQTLERYLADRAAKKSMLPARDLEALAASLARGLSYAHQRGIIHRDLKPANILMASQPVILDFGLAGFVEGTDADNATTLGRVMGTPLYMAPEQAEGGPADVRNDYFSLATILYEAAMLRRGWAEGEDGQRVGLGVPLTGPLRDLNAAPRVYVRVRNAVERLTIKRLDLNPALIDWVTDASAVSSDDRPADLEPLLDALDDDSTTTNVQPQGTPSKGLDLPILEESTGDDDYQDRTLPSPGTLTRSITARSIVRDERAHPDPASGATPDPPPPMERWLVLASIGLALIALVFVGSLVRQSKGEVGVLEVEPVEPPRSDMIALPSLTFTHGCVGEPCDADEPVATTATVAAFELDRTEVTVRAYAACSRCTPAAVIPGRCNAGHPARIDHPVNCIDALQAEAYCSSLGKRLPTAIEWERAARGSTRHMFPWGDAAPACGITRFRECGSTTSSVALHPAGASPEGLLDMAGNVWEWTTDGTNKRREIRGGSFVDVPSTLRISNRGYADATTRVEQIGFRCAK